MPYLLIVYDIPDNRRRLLIDKILSAYGVRVNLSVFEVIPKKRSDINALYQSLIDAMDSEEDSIRIYPMDKKSIADAQELGGRRAPFVQGDAYVF